MSQLIVRNLSPEIVSSLKARAAAHGRSAEAEHREILREALLDQDPGSLKELLARMPDAGRDEDFVRPKAKRRQVRL
jgi:plasmid stability protein